MTKGTEEAVFQEIVRNYESGYDIRFRETSSGWQSSNLDETSWGQTIDSYRNIRLINKTGTEWLRALHYTEPGSDLGLVRVHAPVAVVRASKEDAIERAPRGSNSTIGYSIFYRSMWLVMAILGLGWGFTLGLTVAGAAGLGLSTAVVGTIVIVGLMATLYVAGRQSRVIG